MQVAPHLMQVAPHLTQVAPYSTHVLPRLTQVAPHLTQVAPDLPSAYINGWVAFPFDFFNFFLAQKMGQALERYADHGCKVVVVANPAPTNCVVLSSHAPSIPR